MRAVVDALRGSVRLYAEGVPDGHVRITRTERRTPELIRGGEFDVSTGGFVREDAEAPFGHSLIYRATVEPLIRHIQSNRVLNPKAKDNVTNWLGGTGRTLTREAAVEMAPPRDALTSLKVGPHGAGATVGGLSERTLLSTVPSAFGTGRWFFSGQMYYDSPDLWLWEDVKANTWQQVKDVGTWQQVKSKSSEAAAQPFASLWAMVLGPTKVLTEQRRNLVPNPVAVTATAWSGNAAGGTSTTALLTAQAPPFPGGPTTAHRRTWTVAATAYGGGSYFDGRAAGGLPMPVTPGTVYTGSVYARSSKAQAMQGVVWFYDAAGVAVGGGNYGPPAAVAANTWQRFSSTITAPTGAAYAMVGAYAAGSADGATMWAVNNTLDLTAAMLEARSTASTYFDGDTLDADPVLYNWVGAVHASASTQTYNYYPTIVAPFQVLGVQAVGGNLWHTFSAWVDVPAGAPAGCRLAFLQGPLTREYTVSWWLTTVMVTPEIEMTAGALSPYFDGDTPVPANSAYNLKPGYDWTPTVNDASIVWNGTNNNSVSTFTGPSSMYALATALIGLPPAEALPKVKQPVYFSDPVTPQLGLWFELLALGPLSRRARADLFDVLGRGPQIAVSQKRAWASGEFRLLTRTPEEESIADRLFDSGRILFYRNPDPRYPESGWYLHIGDVQWSRLGDQYGPQPERVWSVPFVRVERPEGLIAASSAITWADLRAGYTWAELRQQREDWLDAALTAAGT